MRRLAFGLSAAMGLVALVSASGDDSANTKNGYKPLFNGKDLSGWRIPEGDNGHWKVVNGVIDYDARSEAKGDKCLWTDKEYGDFVLHIDWRMKTEQPGFHWRVPVLEPDGSSKKDANGKEVTEEIEDLDSGVYVRGVDKCQVNIWRWPVGSGEVWGYRTDPQMPAAVRAGVTPKKNADKPRGEWNTFEIKMQGERLTVKLNGEEVIGNALLPGAPKRGRIALQHHGTWDTKNQKWTGPPALVQFRNIYIKDLGGELFDGAKTQR
jgi:hypothetical protein